MDFSKMSHDGEIHDTYALLKALPDAATDADVQTVFSAATKKIRNRARAVIVAYEDRIPSEVDVRQSGSDVESNQDETVAEDSDDNDDELDEEEEEDDEGDDDEDEDEENGEDEEERKTNAETNTTHQSIIVPSTSKTGSSLAIDSNSDIYCSEVI
jgi:cobalamin biosynthesis protein CobT